MFTTFSHTQPARAICLEGWHRCLRACIVHNGACAGQLRCTHSHAMCGLHAACNVALQRVTWHCKHTRSRGAFCKRAVRAHTHGSHSSKRRCPAAAVSLCSAHWHVRAAAPCPDDKARASCPALVYAGEGGRTFWSMPVATWHASTE